MKKVPRDVHAPSSPVSYYRSASAGDGGTGGSAAAAGDKGGAGVANRSAMRRAASARLSTSTPAAAAAAARAAVLSPTAEEAAVPAAGRMASRGGRKVSSMTAAWAASTAAEEGRLEGAARFFPAPDLLREAIPSSSSTASASASASATRRGGQEAGAARGASGEGDVAAARRRRPSPPPPPPISPPHASDGPGLICALSYRGMEVIFATAASSSSARTPGAPGAGRVGGGNGGSLVAVLTRTRCPFQTLDLPPSSAAAGVVALVGHPVTGLVCAATADGRVYTFHPVEALPAPPRKERGQRTGTGVVVSGKESARPATGGKGKAGYGGGIEPPRPVATFGRYRWMNGRVVECRSLFAAATAAFASGREQVGSDAVMFSRRLPTVTMGGETKDGGDGVDGLEGRSPHSSTGPGHVCLSTSMDHKVLVAHRDQLAVFDARPVTSGWGGGSSGGGGSSNGGSAPQIIVAASSTGLDLCLDLGSDPAVDADGACERFGPPAELLWTARTRATIMHASIAGDGRSIAYVLQGEGEGVPYPYGARTYVRDREDGSFPPPSSNPPPPATTTSAAGPPSSGAVAPHAPSAPLMDRNTDATPIGKKDRSLKLDFWNMARNASLPPPHTSPAALASMLASLQLPLPKDETLGQAARKGDGDPARGGRKGHRRVGSVTSPGGIQAPPVKPEAMYDGSATAFAAAFAPDSGADVEGPRGVANGAVGILYKPGPFLVHSAPVTRLAFRGLGLNHSTLYPHHPDFSLDEDEGSEEGNDLLLTTCESDGSCRVFSQNSWRQLMHWTTPPGSRADFVEGIAAANLGDLDVPPKPKKGKGGSGITSRPGSAPPSRSGSGSGNGSGPFLPTGGGSGAVPPSGGDASSDSGSGGVNRHLLMGQPQPVMPAHPTPSSSAGAWIAELTFRGPFPALRLSRLSYLKSGGDDAAPGHFESVAAVLPPGTIRSAAVLGRVVGGGPSSPSLPPVVGCGDEGGSMTVQGIWPAWDPWDHSSATHAHGGSRPDGSDLEGSAAALLGSAGGVAALSGALGGLGGGAGGPGSGALGGSHSPPGELRIVASHGRTGEVVIMEFPLWGDKDFGAMELGSPLRYQLSLSDGAHCRRLGGTAALIKAKGDGGAIAAERAYMEKAACLREVCLNFESSSRLTASISPDGRSVRLLWRKPGTMNMLPAREMDVPTLPTRIGLETDEEEFSMRRIPSVESIASTASVDSDLSHFSYDMVPEFCKGGASMAKPFIVSMNGAASSVMERGSCRRFVDLSAIPAPLALPALRMPSSQNDRIDSLLWWKDDNFGGPPRLVALTASGALFVYEMPPPWSALEPPMPSYDPFTIGSESASLASSGGGIGSNFSGAGLEGNRQNSGLGVLVKESVGLDLSAHSHLLFQERLRRQHSEGSMGSEEGVEDEYDVSLTPHPDFGLGLRLEAQADGMPAIAGSYKKHPLSGGRLPAERTGAIALGDELLAVNGHCLEGITFDEIIANVRRMGAESRGGPLVMRFRRKRRGRLNSGYGSVGHSAFEATASGEGSGGKKRNAMALQRTGSNYSIGSLARVGTADMGSVAHTVLVGADMETQQEFGRIVAYVKDAFGDLEDKPILPRMVLLPMKGSHDMALLVVAEGRTLTVSQLVVPEGGIGDPEDTEFNRLGSVSLDDGTACEGKGTGETVTSDNDELGSWIYSVDVVNTSAKGGWCLVVTDYQENVSFVFLTLEESTEGDNGEALAKFHICRALSGSEGGTGVDDRASDGIRVRAASVEIFASMCIGKKAKHVTIWSSMPLANRPKTTDTKEASSLVVHDYMPTKVFHTSSGDEEDIIDFRWVASGSIDSFPWLVTFTSSSAVVHRRPGGSISWIKAAEVVFPALSGSVDSLNSGLPGIGGEHRWSTVSPADALPHILPALQSVVGTATDERSYLRSDWHPDSILAYICTEERGAKFALNTTVKGIYQWLSRWMSSDESSRPAWNSSFPLGIAPLRTVRNEPSDEVVEEDAEAPYEAKEESAFALIAALSVGAKKEATKPLSEDELLLSKLQAVLCPSKTKVKECAHKGVDVKKNSKEFPPSITGGAEKGMPVDQGTLPDPIIKLNSDELRFLWAVGELLAHPPKFRKLDSSAQLALFSVTLMRIIEGAEESTDDSSKLNPAESMVSSASLSSPLRSILVKQTSSLSFDSDDSGPPAIASSACLAALLSDSQSALLTACRLPGVDKMDWATARAIRLPFWLRSDSALRKLAEEIGEEVYRRKKDVMECALYFVAMRNIRKLRALAATDRNESGKKFLKFLTDHDFSNPRGRKAAEKNAYSLLRKRKYNFATAFFLLAEPPMLKTALEVIVSQIKDLSLAFLIARLVESNKANTLIPGGLTIGGFGMGFSLGMMGGGGGFAGGGAGQASIEDEADSVGFRGWIPGVGEGTRNFLTQRGLSMAEGDFCFEAVQRLWLGQPDEAALTLAGRHTSSVDGLKEVSMPIDFDVMSAKKQKQPQRGGMFVSSLSSVVESANERVITKSSRVMDFISAPLLLKTMGANSRIRWTSSLLVSKALCVRGMEIPSARTMLQSTDLTDLKGNDERGKVEEELSGSSVHSLPQPLPANSAGRTGEAPGHSKTGIMASSIFEGFDAAPSERKPSASQIQPPSEMASSIFDSFDAAPPKPRQKQASMPDTTGGGMSSLIFDSFDPIPVTNKPKPKAAAHGLASGEMSSSIFDSFDVAPAKPDSKQHVSEAPASGEMASSIFDSFDVAPQKPKINTTRAQHSANGEMQSSIFDSFDTVPKKSETKPTVSAPVSGEMASSIFDSFDAAPQKPKSKPVQASPSGDMKSSIFDTFESPRLDSHVYSGNSPTIPGKSHESIGKELKYEIEIFPPLPIPPIWAEWREVILVASTARRFLRELARIISRFEGDALVPPMALFRRHVHPLVPSGAGHVLQYHCQGNAILNSAEMKIQALCADNQVDTATVIEQALSFLTDPCFQPRRIVFTVLLHCLNGRSDLAEDVVRDAAQHLMLRCLSFASSYDDIADKRKTRHHASSQHIRRQASIASWQLELCLWLQRGGTFTLSGLAVKEATVAVRIGLVLASWGRNHDTFEKLLRCEPDCSMDHEVGRQLWSSMKMIVGYHDKAVKGVGPSSGGWEFLVDCRRDEATDMLRDRKPGSFLIRPHADDHGVFTLSFRTNLVPTVDVVGGADGSASPRKGHHPNGGNAESTSNGPSGSHGAPPAVPPKSGTDTKSGSARPVKRDDVVQHAIIRLSDAGFRCGSFGPFTSLMKLLEAISTSLPFNLSFSEPPIQGIIKEQGTSPSPNSFFLRKLSLHSKSNHFKWNTETQVTAAEDDEKVDEVNANNLETDLCHTDRGETDENVQRRFGMFSQLLALSEVRKQLSSIAAAEFDELLPVIETWQEITQIGGERVDCAPNVGEIDDFDGSLSASEDDLGEEEMYTIASRLLRPLLEWCRTLEIAIVHEIAPALAQVPQGLATMPVDVAASETAIEIAPSDIGSCIDGGDAVIRHMIQPGSGVEFRTLRLGEGGQSAIVVLFSMKEAISWLVTSGAEKDEADAAARLRIMEKRRVIEQIDVNELAVGKSSASDVRTAGRDIRYRFVDPWEVEVVETKEGEVAGASLGRGHYLSFNVGTVARSCEQVQRSLGGLHLLGLWSLAKGGLFLTKALASVYPPWERDAGGDLQMKGGAIAEPPPYTNSMREHLYRNTLFRRLRAPQRFLALIQVELLDLKNLTSPSGTHTLTAYALLRLKRPGSGAPLTHKARTLDSAATQPKKISKSLGPNAPASWGSLVRFRFPLPEDVDCDGVSFDGDKEALFKGAPSVLQISVYEKKFMSDSTLGGADVKLDLLSSGGQLEEWVPLRAPHEKGGITWFARLRLTLRFELMCLETDEAEAEASMNSDRCPSVGLRRIKELSRLGGAHEDTKGIKKSVSTPDLLTYLESMVY